MPLSSRRRGAISPASLDLDRFEPIGPNARQRIDELIMRGARIVRVTRHAVVLRRAAQIATVDPLGRVSWAG